MQLSLAAKFGRCNTLQKKSTGSKKKDTHTNIHSLTKHHLIELLPVMRINMLTSAGSHTMLPPHIQVVVVITMMMVMVMMMILIMMIMARHLNTPP